MALGASIEDLLASLKPEAWNGIVYRVMLNDHPPDRENTQGARWNPPDTAAIYTCLEPSVCIAEVDYNLARQPRPVRPGLRKRLYKVNVKLAAVVDLTMILSDLAAVGIETSALFADDMKVSQEIGRQVTWFGCDGLLVPSARSIGKNLIIFPGRANDTYRFEVIDQRSL